MSARTPLVTFTTLIITGADASGTALPHEQFITDIPVNNVPVLMQNLSSTNSLIDTYDSLKSSTIESPSRNYMDEKFNRVEREISSYLQLEPNWDYSDGVVPQNNSVKTSIDFLHLLKRFQLPLPKPMLAGDGEVCLYWKKENFYIEVGFEEEGEFSYAVDNHKTPFGQDDCNLDDFIKTKLFASLNNFQLST